MYFIMYTNKFQQVFFYEFYLLMYHGKLNNFELLKGKTVVFLSAERL